MSERIKKLVDRAIDDIPDNIDFDIPPEFCKKFAELIVWECIAWVEDNNGHDGPSTSAMREHFGVE